MSKRVPRVVLILAFASVWVLGLNVSGNPLTALAAPGSQSLSDMLPDETALYVDVHTDKISDFTDLLNNLSTKVSGHPLPDIFANINQGLTQALGRKATFQDDIQPWLGNDVGVGLMINDADAAQIQAMTSASANTTSASTSYKPAYVVLSTIKDQAKFDAFYKELWSKVPASSQSNYTTQTPTVAGAKITVLHQTAGCDTSNCVDLALGNGFVAAGSADGITRLLDTLNGQKAILSRNATFSRLSASLKPTDYATVYIGSRALYLEFLAFARARSVSASMLNNPSDLATPAAPTTPQPNPMDKAIGIYKEAISALNGMAYSVRHDGNVLALDVATSVNPTTLNKALTDMGFPAGFATTAQPKAISGVLLNQVPAKAIFVIHSNGLGTLYDTLKGTLKAYQKMGASLQPLNSGQSSSQLNNLNKIIVGLGAFEGGFNAAFNMDFRNDVLGALNGDFAIYTLYNPNSTLYNPISKGVNGKPGAPLDLALIAQVSDTAKIKSDLDKFNTGITTLTNVAPTSAGQDLYQVTVQNGVTIDYGLVGNTFVITTGSGLDTAVAAIKGDGAIGNDPVWKAALASSIQKPSRLIFLNFNQLSDAINSMQSSSRSGQRMTPGMNQGLALLGALDSAAISAAPMSPDGFAQGTVQITLKP